jgi:hypothetical protein
LNCGETVLPIRAESFDPLAAALLSIGDLLLASWRDPFALTNSLRATFLFLCGFGSRFLAIAAC